MRFKIQIMLYIFISAFSMPLFAQKVSFYAKAYMPEGPLKGHQLDTTQLRGIVRLANKVNGVQSLTHDLIGNFHHEGKFYIAKVPRKGPSGVSFIYEKFTNMPGGHADVVYHFDIASPVELIAEIVDTNTARGFDVITLKQPIVLADVVLTSEAVSTVNHKPGLVEGGLTNQFAMVHRLTSVPQRLFNPVLVERRPTTVFHVPMDPIEVNRSFSVTIRNASILGMATNYNLIYNNCITSAVTALSNGFVLSERKDLEKQIAKSMLQLNRLQTEDIKDIEIKEIVGELLVRLRVNGQEIRSSPIQTNAFFTSYLTQKQEELLSPKVCLNLFTK